MGADDYSAIILKLVYYRSVKSQHYMKKKQRDIA